MGWYLIAIDKLDETATAETARALMQKFDQEYRTAGAPVGAEVWASKGNERREFLFSEEAAKAAPSTMHSFGAKQLIVPTDPGEHGFKKLLI